MPSPVIRIAPKPRRRTVRSPRAIVPAVSSVIGSAAIPTQASLRDMSALLAVPNVSEGSDEARLRELEEAFERGAKVLDRHTDEDHERAVFTLAAPAAGLLT